MAATADDKLALLDSAVLAATAASQTLSVWLAAELLARFNGGIRTGKHLVGATAGGTSSSFQIAGALGLHPQDVFRFWAECRRLYTLCAAALLAANGSAANQAAIVVEMQFRLQPMESAVARFDDEWCGVGTEAPA